MAGVIPLRLAAVSPVDDSGVRLQARCPNMLLTIVAAGGGSSGLSRHRRIREPLAQVLRIGRATNGRPPIPRIPNDEPLL